ncbi:PDZ domain-containing protein [Edwardsiella ictaluri]|uniref:Protease DegQ, putative n=2 Tax=Edwardsiella ictaluri TaxID=67780 RepID=C5B743_EDWI9|nr:PDZ domain-containing protein [Edwardsiella ictaluri]ACR67817.1 protease DegQ, putative [Edwardsiella ictaluri 93-146]UCQ48275.1 PDZ domain-containing protein [Edwardsiella ictaluri]UCQ51541.1 PDZ domain-containing protein [Edwardsiella ictaluri]UYB62216.1 PDZ domain-containing protein [Edwardsiella ictaluri]UYB65441.1 PDZ domain-containing protein [Edwardsiella ictaluri]
MTADLANAFKLDSPSGTFVNEILPKSVAARAGIRAGNELIPLNDTPIGSFAELRAKEGSVAPDTALQIGLLRNGKPMNVTVILENHALASVQGKTLTPTLARTSLSPGAIQKTSGICSDTLENRSPAAQIGLHKADLVIGVNHLHTRNIAALRSALVGDPPVIALHLIRGGEGMYLLRR